MLRRTLQRIHSTASGGRPPFVPSAASSSRVANPQADAWGVPAPAVATLLSPTESRGHAARRGRGGGSGFRDPSSSSTADGRRRDDYRNGGGGNGRSFRRSGGGNDQRYPPSRSERGKRDPQWMHALRLVDATRTRAGASPQSEGRAKLPPSPHGGGREAPSTASRPTVSSFNSVDGTTNIRKSGAQRLDPNEQLRAALAGALAEVIASSDSVPNSTQVADDLLSEILEMDEAVGMRDEVATTTDSHQQSPINAVPPPPPLLAAALGTDPQRPQCLIPPLEAEVRAALTLSQVLSAVRRCQSQLGGGRGAGVLCTKEGGVAAGEEGAAAVHRPPLLVPLSVGAVLSLGDKVTRRRGANGEAALQSLPRAPSVGALPSAAHSSEGSASFQRCDANRQHDSPEVSSIVEAPTPIPTPPRRSVFDAQRELLRHILSSVAIVTGADREKGIL